MWVGGAWVCDLFLMFESYSPAATLLWPTAPGRSLFDLLWSVYAPPFNTQAVPSSCATFAGTFPSVLLAAVFDVSPAFYSANYLPLLYAATSSVSGTCASSSNSSITNSTAQTSDRHPVRHRHQVSHHKCNADEPIMLNEPNSCV